MKYVTTMGAVFKISERKFKALQRELKTTGTVEDLEKYGTTIIDRLYTISEIKSELSDE